MSYIPKTMALGLISSWLFMQCSNSQKQDQQKSSTDSVIVQQDSSLGKVKNETNKLDNCTFASEKLALLCESSKELNKQLMGIVNEVVNEIGSGTFNTPDPSRCQELKRMIHEWEKQVKSLKLKYDASIAQQITCDFTKKENLLLYSAIAVSLSEEVDKVLAQLKE